MAETLETTKVDVNPLTGLPYGGSPTVETSGPVDVPINPLTGVAFKNPTPTSTLGGGGGTPDMMNEQLYGSQYNIYRQDDISRYKDYGVPLGQDLDWDEIRARNQSTAEQWGRGLAKAGVTTLGAVAENTLGIVAGLGELVTGGAYYDNFVGNSIDKTNAWMQEYMPNYRTQEEQNMSTMQKVGTANFWADTVAGGLGYSIGSLATMYFTGGVGFFARGASLAAKGLGVYNTSKAIINGTALATKLAKGTSAAHRLKTALQTLEVGAMMSLAEASVESRETQRSTYDGMVEHYLSERPGYTVNDIPADVLKDFEDVSYDAGNTNFVIQMPVLMGTNLLMFGKQIAGFRGVSKVSKDVIFDSAASKAVNTLAQKGIVAQSLQRLKPMFYNGLEETVQESLQMGSGAFASTYHTDKYNNGGYGDMSKALSAAGTAMRGKEGQESALVGFLTGMIMGGGQSIVGKEYSNRKQQAQMLTDLVNQGIFDNTQRSVQNANASSAASARMEGHLKDGNLKKFKDEQFKLIQYQALEAKNRGGLQLIMEKLEDAKGLSETEFMKQFGYPTEDAEGNILTLKDSGDKSQDAIIDGFKKKLKNFEKVHESVTKQFPLADKTKGLPRRLMSEEARKAEDKVYNHQERLRTELILSGSEINDRVRRMEAIDKGMKKTLNNTTSDNWYKQKGLETALADQYKTPGEVDASEFDALTQYEETAARLKRISENLKTSNPTLVSEFNEQANDYLALMGENNIAIDRYNKLSSNEYAQAQFQKELDIAEAEAQQNKVDKQITEALKEATTKKELIDLDSDNASPEVQREYNKKLAEFRDAEALEFRKYMEENPGETKQQHLERLKKIDKKDLTPSEIEGLNQAIEVLAEETSEEVKEEVEPTEEDFREEDEKGIQKAFIADNLAGIEGVSEDGRSFIIEGEEYFNQETNPLDAILRTKRGKMRGIRLTKKRNGQVDVIWGKDKMDVLAYVILNTEQSKVDSNQGVPVEDILDLVEVVKEEVDLDLISKQPHGAKTSESLNVEIHDLSLSLSAVLESIDTLRTYYIQEAEATKEDLKNDPELKALSRKAKSLRIQIAQRKRILNLRGDNSIPSSEQELKAERNILDKISEKEDNITDMESDIKSLESDLSQYESEAERYKNQDDFESFKQANRNAQAAEKLIDESLEQLKKLENSLSYYKSKLNKFKNEQEENNIDENGEQVESDPTEGVEGQNDGRESEDTGEVVEEEGAPVDNIQVAKEKGAIPSKESFTNEEEETRKAIQITKNSNENNNTEQQTIPGAPVQQGFIMGLPEGMTEEDLRGPVEESPVQEGFIRPVVKPAAPVMITDVAGMPIKYKRNDVKNNKDLRYNIHIDDLIAKGENAGNENLSFKLTNLRANIDGRKIVEIIIPETGETFLFYKSTGTGTTADTKGLWAPIPGFAADEWFLKRYHEGVDPKKNKYNVPFFKKISDYLEKNESIGVEVPVALAAESDFNPTNVPQAKRDELSKYVTENLGDIVDIKTKELKYDRRNAKGEVLGVETAIEYTVSFSNGTTLSTVPEEGRIEGLPAGLSAIKIGVGMWNLIEQSKAPTQQTSEVNEGIENTDNTELEIKAANTTKVVKVGNKYRVQVDSSDNPVMYPADTVDGKIIKINKDLLLDPNIKNEVVTLEIIANDYYKGLGDETSESWKNIPIYYKIKNEYVGKLGVSDSLERKYIVDQLLAGNSVTTKISNIMAGPRNMNHTVSKNGERVFLNPETTFGKNEVILAVVNKSPMKTGVITGPVDAFLDQGDLEAIQGALSTQPLGEGQTGLKNGQIVSVIRPKNNPQGDPRITPLLTENLNEAHAMLVMDLFAKGEYDKVKEIIATSAEPSASNKFISIDSYPDGSSSITYKSEATGGLVRIKDFYLAKALRGETYKFDDVKFKDGNVLKYKADRGEKVIDIKKDLTEFIKGKKYNVNNDLINLAGDYTSPLTEEVYKSTATEPFGYQQYLFSDTELSGEKSILSTDLVKIGESMFNNPEVTFNKVSVTDSEGVTTDTQKKKKSKLAVVKKVDKSIQTPGINRDDIGFEEDPNSCI